MITFLSDFGTSDYFVAAVKGVIKTMAPLAEVVDITHQIPPQDIASASFTLSACYQEFPRGTVHLAVVDPGVGSSRHPLVIESAGHFFVGPDNGLFTFALDADPGWRAVSACRREKLRPATSATFHGRDIFAPLAAHLQNGAGIDELGEKLTDPVRLDIQAPVLEGNRFSGSVIHIDRLGNCITNLPFDEAPDPIAFEIAGRKVEAIVSYYAEVYDKSALFAYPGSAGYWEFGLWQDSASERLGIRRGDTVKAVVRTQ